MKLGMVVGTVVATQKDEKLQGMRLLLVRDVSLRIEEKDTFVVAADSVGAGEGELVLYASGSSARMTQATQNKPIDATIMAIVDTVVVGRETRYEKVPSRGSDSQA
jgi:microcompartment protein CcmK/EutM